MVTVEKVLNDIEKNQMAPVYLVLGEEQVNAETKTDRQFPKRRT